MPGFGERLKYEREARNVTIERIAVSTGIRLSYLEALEGNEFHALPGRAFGKLYIRAYAKVLGFDPQPLIRDYDREQQHDRPASKEASSPNPVRPRPVEAAITSWRELKMAERNKAVHGVVSAEVDRAPAMEGRSDGPSDVGGNGPCDAPLWPEIGNPVQAEPAGELEEERTEIENAARIDPAEVLEERTTEIVHRVPAEHDEADAVLVPHSVARPRIRPKRPIVLVVLLLLGVFVGAVAAYRILFVRTGVGESGALSSAPSAREQPIQDSSPAESARHTKQKLEIRGPQPSQAAQPPAAPPLTVPAGKRSNSASKESLSSRSTRPAQTVSSTAMGAGVLTVTESGVGRRVVGHTIDGRDERFTEGNVVWFWTHVLGGKRGEVIRHVWLQEGRAVQSIVLRLGGPDWRTQTRKTLRDTGRWAVEARDTEGRILASETFTCERASP